VTERRHELRRFPWRVRDSGQLVLVVAAGLVLVASVAQTAVTGLRDPRVALAFGVLIILLLIVGSLWIMTHLNQNMLPMDRIMQMQR